MRVETAGLERSGVPGILVDGGLCSSGRPGKGTGDERFERSTPLGGITRNPGLLDRGTHWWPTGDTLLVTFVDEPGEAQAIYPVVAEADALCTRVADVAITLAAWSFREFSKASSHSNPCAMWSRLNVSAGGDAEPPRAHTRNGESCFTSTCFGASCISQEPIGLTSIERPRCAAPSNCEAASCSAASFPAVLGDAPLLDSPSRPCCNLRCKTCCNCNTSHRSNSNSCSCSSHRLSFKCATSARKCPSSLSCSEARRCKSK